MTYTLEIKKDYTLSLLKALEEQQAIEMKLTEEAAVAAPNPVVRRPTFDAIRVSTKGFKFNRDEASER